jgi:hypothetical protein
MNVVSDRHRFTTFQFCKHNGMSPVKIRTSESALKLGRTHSKADTQGSYLVYNAASRSSLATANTARQNAITVLCVVFCYLALFCTKRNSNTSVERFWCK